MSIGMPRKTGRRVRTIRAQMGSFGDPIGSRLAQIVISRGFGRVDIRRLHRHLQEAGYRYSEPELSTMFRSAIIPTHQVEAFAHAMGLTEDELAGRAPTTPIGPPVSDN